MWLVCGQICGLRSEKLAWCDDFDVNIGLQLKTVVKVNGSSGLFWFLTHVSGDSA